MIPQLPRRRSILYVGDLNPFSTSQYRFASLQQLGQNVHPFDLRGHIASTRSGRWLQHRYPLGPVVARINRKLRRTVTDLSPDLVWFDKPTLFTRETMRAIHRAGAQIVFYVQDSPFGPRNDGCWMQFKLVFRIADLHCLVRQADVARYDSWQLPWIKVLLSFDPRTHYPPPSGFSDGKRTRTISYIGHPYEDRPAFLLKLARKVDMPLFVSGNLWSRLFTAEQQGYFRLGGYLAGGQYRSGIWNSKINLCFVTHENEEDIAHKAVEIAACAGFLLGLRTPGHQAIFEEDREAVFFSSVEECADKCRFYLNRPDLREAISARGRERAVRGGYDNDTQLARVLNRLDGREG